jgi:hypothetical protein
MEIEMKSASVGRISLTRFPAEPETPVLDAYPDIKNPGIPARILGKVTMTLHNDTGPDRLKRAETEFWTHVITDTSDLSLAAAERLVLQQLRQDVQTLLSALDDALRSDGPVTA